jgi:hypothetical protein
MISVDFVLEYGENECQKHEKITVNREVKMSEIGKRRRRISSYLDRFCAVSILQSGQGLFEERSRRRQGGEHGCDGVAP